MKKKAIKGIALVEVLISIVVLAVGITTMLFTFRNLITAVKRVDDNFFVRLKASNYYEELYSGICDNNFDEYLSLDENMKIGLRFESEKLLLNTDDEDTADTEFAYKLKGVFLKDEKNIMQIKSLLLVNPKNE